MDFISLIVHHLADADIWQVAPGIVFTKHMLMMSISALLLVGLVPLAVQSEGMLGRRARGVMEAYAEFIWRDIVSPALGPDGRIFLPYFLSLFLFLMVMNVLGLIPFGASPTGNISVTAAFSLMSLSLILAVGIRRHGLFAHFKNLIPHGVPAVMAPFIFLLELMGYVTKTLALCIRLCANMVAGHLVILLFLGLILYFGQMNSYLGLAVAPVSIGLAVAIFLLELIVAVVQAYVFTMLTAVFVGGALHPDH